MALTIEDRLDILDLFARYTHHVDENEAAEWVDLFTADARFEIVGQAVLTGHEQLSGMPAMAAQVGGGKMRHQITDILIDSDTGGSDRASARASGLITNWNPGAAPAFARYVAALAKQDGKWKFETLTSTMLAG